MDREEDQEYIEWRDEFIGVVKKAVGEQVEPFIFSEEKRAEMRLPYHQPLDHYHVGVQLTVDEPFFSQCHGVSPRIFIEDPSVTRRQFNSIPKKVKVNFKGVSYAIPLSKELCRPTFAREWAQSLKRWYMMREAVDKLEQGLKKVFRFSAGEDYSIRYGICGGSRADYVVQYYPRDSIAAEYNEAAPGHVLARDVKEYICRELKNRMPDQPAEVRIIGAPWLGADSKMRW